MKKSNVMPSMILGVICLVSALLLSVINFFTAPKIEKNRKEAEIKALQEVLPAGTYFDPIEITEDYPSVITGGYKSDAGFVFKSEVKGYKSGLIIMVGVDNDGKIAGVKHTASQETFGAESELNQKYTDRKDNEESLEMILSASASKGAPMTAGAYYSAVSASLDAYKIASGKVTYPGVESVEVNESGEYTIVSYAAGSQGKITVKVIITPDGKIKSVEVISHSETPSIGGVLLDGLIDGQSFTDKFLGKGKDEVNSVDNETGATDTSKGFKEALNNAFKAYEALTGEGGNQ